MKTIIVCCGSSMITSSVAIEKIKVALKEENLDANIIQCKFAEVAGIIDNQHIDLVVPTGALKEEQTKGVPVIKGTSFITGVNEKGTLDSIIEFIKK